MHEALEKAESNAEQLHPKSKGEELFDWLVYGGVSGLGVFVATVPIAYWLKYAGGKKAFEASAKMLENSGMDPRSSHEFLMTTALMQGGNLAIVPVKILEERKAEIVSHLNKMLGEPDTYCEVKKEPDQTWGSLIKSRLVAWGVIFASFKAAGMAFGAERFDKFEAKFAKKIVCNPLGLASHLASGEETRAFRMGKLAALDVFATAASATILYIASRFFAEPDKDQPATANEKHVSKAPMLAAPESTEPIAATNAPEKPPSTHADTATHSPATSRSILALTAQKRASSFAEAAHTRENQKSSLVFSS